MTPTKRTHRALQLTAALLAMILLSACATREIQSKLFDMSTGKVLAGSFLWKGQAYGPTTIKREAEECVGEYRTVTGGSIGVGVGAAAGPWGTLFSSLHSVSTVDKSQKGIAIAICPSGVTFDCEYITNVALSGVDGHGVCKDNRGATYRLLF